MADPPDGKIPEPWQRFTLLDLFLLQGAFALGLSCACTVFPAEERWDLRVVTGVAFGVVLAGPIVFATQWTLRGRRAPPSLGEQLWLASFVCWTAGFSVCLLQLLLAKKGLLPGAGYAASALGFALCPLWVAQNVFSGFAVWRLIEKGGKRGDAVPCVWTDRFGNAACLLFGVWIWYLPVAAFFESL